ncbi:MAG: glycoside hydrolase family 3 C-terminal domain-containing protein [Blautia sp.]|nr:glycoside hydrolase family 3 C-terminal domain-containing protein [Blautia sp.]
MYYYENKHMTTVLDNAAECTVLLKKDGKFPLPGPCKLAAYGSGMRYTVKGGTGSGEVNSRFTYTIEQGLERAGFEITTKTWLEAYDKIRASAKKDFYKDIKAEAKARHENAILYAMGREMTEPDYSLPLSEDADAAIYVVSRNSGEGSDRTAKEGDVRLTKTEVRDILKLSKKFEKFMLVLNVGGVVDLSPVTEVGNILLLSQLGVDCGRILSDILTGKQNPSGKLTTTWAGCDDYCKAGSFGEWNETAYNEGIYVGYRYFDTFKKQPLFPFGYGLSYTDFRVHTESVTVLADDITVMVQVTNTGTYAGREVVQVYLSLPDGKLDKAYQELCGFAKTRNLQTGESETLEITFKLSDFASYDYGMACYILEGGDYIVRVGNSSRFTEIAAVITLDETVVTIKTRNCFGRPDFVDLVSDQREREEIPDHAVRLSVCGKDVPSTTAVFDRAYEIDERIKKYSDEELAYFVIGNFDVNAKGLSIIGNAATHVAGAAGETTAFSERLGIRPLIMADGPAGLRLCREYYEDEKGAHGVNSSPIPASLLEMMGPAARFVAGILVGGSKAPRKAVIKEQAATMIPIGTAIAQSFNTELAKTFGDLVGEEMEMFGVNLWLAPALNIHRSILCGRNFEYYSEDPLVSGLMAAAITQGVQSHKGCGTTIKHYAANNAETNRYCNNSQVSERAMREIYLRGFGIAVRKAQPKAVMTSYNLLNGIHTAEHRGLIEDVLRCEFGFSGIVMTDWVIEMMKSANSVHRNSLSNEVVKAGGDLFMPGCRKDYDKVLAALKNGSLSREQLLVNATRVLRVAETI